jgi:hypothetical protein
MFYIGILPRPTCHMSALKVRFFQHEVKDMGWLHLFMRNNPSGPFGPTALELKSARKFLSEILFIISLNVTK